MLETALSSTSAHERNASVAYPVFSGEEFLGSGEQVYSRLDDLVDVDLLLLRVTVQVWHKTTSE